jgi:predicted aspartyl protease
MKNTTLAKFGIKVAVFYFSLAGFCQTIHAQSEIKLRLVHDTVVVVSMMANDQGPFDFVLDTGTNTTVVDPSVAHQLSLAAIDRIQLNTMNGIQTLTRSSLHTLGAGPAHAENVEVLVQDLAEFRQLDSHIQGVVGQNFLAHFNYLLDYKKHSLRIEAAQEVRNGLDGEQIPMERRENMMIVTSEAQWFGRAKLRLLLDSGANVVVLTRRPSQAVDRSTQQNWLEVTASGETGMQMGRVHSLLVGAQQLHDLPVALPTSQASDTERVEDGLLPTSLFRTLYVNNSEGFVEFNPRVKKN